jgi:hypothetical protein
MPTPVGPNQPNRAFGTTPYAEQQPEPEAEQPSQWVRDALERKFTAASPDTPTSQDPPAPAGGSNTTRTDRQSPTEDIAAATADPTGEHDGSGISGSSH